MKYIVKVSTVLLLTTLLGGCVSNPERHRADWEPVVPPVQPKKIVTNGSIYQSSRQESLFSENRLHQPGDLLTVELAGDGVNMTKTADAEVTKHDESPATLFTTVLADGFMPTGMNGGEERKFGGDGTLNISNGINTGTITVTVEEVYSNGNLRVRGEKRYTINDGDEIVRVAGVVRPADISATNTVSSMKIADAQIVYVGESGMLANATSQGWLGRFFMSALMPF